MQALTSSFAGLSLRPAPTARRNQPFVSNGNAQRLAMKSKHTWQVEVSAEGAASWGPGQQRACVSERACRRLDCHLQRRSHPLAGGTALSCGGGVWWWWLGGLQARRGRAAPPCGCRRPATCAQTRLARPAGFAGGGGQ